MKFAFVTCVELGLSCIDSIYNIGGKLDLLITLTDEQAKNKSGRVFLDDFSKKHNVNLVKIKHINDPEVIELIQEEEIDWLFIIGWSQIVSEEVLNAPKLGCIGMHPTLLPYGRGRASVPWAILKGLKKTGVTMFKLDKGVDTGPIIGKEVIPLINENATSLYKKVAMAHNSLIKRYFPKLQNSTVEFTEQSEHEATYWPGRKPQDGEFKPKEMTVKEVDRLVRATTRPYPGAYIRENGCKILIWSGTEEDKKYKNHSDALKIDCKDGIYLAIDYQKERLKEAIEGEVPASQNLKLYCNNSKNLS